jgi:hypothetical protein
MVRFLNQQSLQGRTLPEKLSRSILPDDKATPIVTTANNMTGSTENRE